MRKTAKKNALPADNENSVIEIPSGNKIEQTTAEVLTAIRQHLPGQQNQIVRELLRELAYDRENEYKAHCEQRDSAAKNMDELLCMSEVAAIAIKERANKEAQPANSYR